LCLQAEVGGSRNCKQFRHEAKWFLEDGYNETMQQAWLDSSEGETAWSAIKLNLDRCQDGLVRWQQTIKRQSQQPIHRLQQRLAELQGDDHMGDPAEIKAVQRDLGVMLDKLDLQWQQRAKVEWLKCGDRNTRFFHECANSRRKSNFIYSISDANGRLRDSEEEVQKAFINYFKELFTSDSTRNMNPCLQWVNSRVTTEMNESLLKPFCEEEVLAALNQMAPLKAPGPDGFTAGFFRRIGN
jgi:hypothetical protein